MTRNVVQAVSARLAASFFGLLLLLSPALAGDRALINFIGFSEDGKHFAFEEYGVQDGSGFAYSSIYVIDLANDMWTYGTPFDARAPEDAPDTPLSVVRTQALERAQESLKPRKVTQPVEILALLGEGVTGTDGKTMSFSTPMCCGPGQTQDDAFTLTLETFPAKSSLDYCADLDSVGYALSITNANGTTELHRDKKTIPASRGCTLDYRLYAVVQPFEGGPGGRVAILSTYPQGFEGPDRRFLAIAIDAT